MALYLGSNEVAITKSVETGGGGSEWTDVSSSFTFDTSYIDIVEFNARTNGSVVVVGGILQLQDELNTGFLTTNHFVGINNSLMILINNDSENISNPPEELYLDLASTYDGYSFEPPAVGIYDVFGSEANIYINMIIPYATWNLY